MRERKSVQEFIVGAKLSVFKLVSVKNGEKDIPGLTDTAVPYWPGPQRTNRIGKFFSLSKGDDIHQYIVRKPLNKKK